MSSMANAPAPAPAPPERPAMADCRGGRADGARERHPRDPGEVRNSLDFHRSQDGGGEVSHVVLSGSALDLPGFAEALQGASGLEVRSETVQLDGRACAGDGLNAPPGGRGRPRDHGGAPVRAVNLIPLDQRGGSGPAAGRSQGGAYAVLVLLAGLAVLALLYGVARHEISSRQARRSRRSPPRRSRPRPGLRSLRPTRVPRDARTAHAGGL